MVKLVKVIDKRKKFKNAKGNEQYVSYFALESENGRRTLIKPTFSDDYKILEYLAQKVFIEV